MDVWMSDFPCPAQHASAPTQKHCWLPRGRPASKVPIALAARERTIALRADRHIDAEVDLNLADDGYFLSIRLNVSLPGVEREVAQALLEAAHKICPYSKAARGNVDVATTLV